MHGHSGQGEDHPMVKLTREQVLEIRRLYAEEGLTQKELAERFGLKNQTTVSKILKGEGWQLGGVAVKRKKVRWKSKSFGTNQPLSDAVKAEVLRLYALGTYRQDDIARMCHVSQGSVSRIVMSKRCGAVLVTAVFVMALTLTLFGVVIDSGRRRQNARTVSDTLIGILPDHKPLGGRLSASTPPRRPSFGKSQRLLRQPLLL
jgi:predicted DNA-binding protein (UPF0251 family)